MHGKNITAERITRGLRFTLTEHGRKHLEIALDLQQGTHEQIWRWLVKDLDDARSLHLVTDEENANLIGALTSSPIFVTAPSYDEDQELVAFDAVFWFPNYQIESELETLRRDGAVTFELGSEPQDLMSCECGLQTYDLEKMHAHKCKKVRD